MKPALTLLGCFSLLCVFDMTSAQIKFPGANSAGSRTGQQGAAKPVTCPTGQGVFQNACHKLLFQGAPCPAQTWLVSGAQGTAACQAQPCPTNQFLWIIGNRRFCGHRTAGLELCNAEEHLVAYTNAEKKIAGCDCQQKSGPIFLYWPDDGKCHELYKKGPCTGGDEILVYDAAEKFLACQVNPCDVEGQVLWNDGNCYEIKTTGPCIDGKEVISINATNLTPECAILDLRQIINPADKNACPPGTKRDFLQQCKSQTLFSSGGVGGSKCSKGFIQKPSGECVQWFR